MSKYVKNADTVDHTWVGTLITTGSYYLLSDKESAKFSDDDLFLADLSLGKALMAETNDGLNDITDLSLSINFIKNLLPVQVETKTEMDDIILKMACGSYLISNAGDDAVVNMLIPGTVNPMGDETLDGRYVESGFAFFDNAIIGDSFKVVIVDINGISGYPPGTVVGSYTEDYSSHTSDTNNDAGEGWYSGPDNKVGVESLGYYGFIGSGYYMRITGTKSDGSIDTMRVNVKWGKKK